MVITNFTSGPWQWSVRADGTAYLHTPDRGHLVVMDCVRRGRAGAPRFSLWPAIYSGAKRDRQGGVMTEASEWQDSRCEINHPDARLMAAAPDHALLCWAMCIGAARWEPLESGYGGAFCINGLRHSTMLDEFGAPIVTEPMRAAIYKAAGLTSA